MVWEGQRLKSYTPASTGSGRVNAYTYNYDENGIRTRKTVGNTVTDYYYNGSLLIGIVQTTTNSDGSTETSIQRFSYDANGQVIAVNYNGTYYYYLRNAQGDVVKLIDKTGSTVVEYTYDSWGKLLSTTGSLAETFGTEQPFRYRGYVYDEETGFYYLQSRYYNPEVGCFISADVYLSTGQGVIGHNAYAYCLNNPVNMSDLSGYSAICYIPNANQAMLEGGNSGYFGGFEMPVGSSSGTVMGFFTIIVSIFTILFSAVSDNSVATEATESMPSYPGDDPNKSPGDDWEWKGKGSPSSGKGNYTNPNTGESLHPDLNHPKPVGPRWDYKDPLGKWWRLFPDGSISPK